jgi:signal peptidase I
MKKEKKKIIELPTIEELEAEISRKKHKQTQHHLLRNALYALITVAAVTALIAILFMPVLKTYGNSMSPTLEDGEIVLTVRTKTAETGDVIAFYYNGKLFIKRVIALGGSVVDMDEDGNISVNGVPLEEPYLTEKSYGNGDVEFPFEVPDGQYFVLGDNRITSADSRNSILGCVDPEDMLGRVLACVWPPKSIGAVH